MVVESMTEPLDDARGELLACPFCGSGNASVRPVGGSPGYWVKCGSCGAESDDASTPEWAAKRWNTRPAPVPQCEAVAWARIMDGQAVTVSRIRNGANNEPLYATPPSRSDAESARAAAVEECARRVESTGLRNPDNIARDIRALVTDEMVDAGARALWRSSTYQGYNDETLEREWLRMCGIWRNQVRQVLAAALVPPPSEAGREEKYLTILHSHFVEMLAERYRNGEAVDIAELCDTKLDRSGRLLGEVRAAALSPDPGTVAVASAELLSPGHAGTDAEMPADGYSHSSTLRETP